MKGQGLLKVNKFDNKVPNSEEAVEDKFGQDIRETVREIFREFFQIELYRKEEIDEQSKKRVEKIFKKAEKEREIVNFLSLPGQKPYRDFVIIAIKKGKYSFFSLKIKESDIEANEYKKRQEKLKMEFDSRFFIESLVMVVNSQKSDKELRRNWQEILKHFKES